MVQVTWAAVSSLWFVSFFVFVFLQGNLALFNQIKLQQLQDQLSSLQQKMVATRSKKPIYAPSHLSEVSPTLSLKRFQCSSDWWWPSLVLSRRIVKCFLFPRLSPSGDRCCDALGFVPAGSTSSPSTLQIFQEASHSWELLCPPVVRTYVVLFTLLVRKVLIHQPFRLYDFGGPFEPLQCGRTRPS